MWSWRPCRGAHAAGPQVTRDGLSVIRSHLGNSNGVTPQHGVTPPPSTGDAWVTHLLTDTENHAWTPVTPPYRMVMPSGAFTPLTGRRPVAAP